MAFSVACALLMGLLMIGVQSNNSDCEKGSLYTFSLFQKAEFVPTVLVTANREFDCGESVCPGDLWVTKQGVYYDKECTMSLGDAVMSCVGLNTVNQSFCEATFEVKGEEDSFHAHGIFAFGNETIFSLIGGNGYWDATLGSIRATPKRWDVGMCFASEECGGGQLMYRENAVDITLIPGLDGTPTGANALYVLSNTLTAVEYGTELGTNIGQCVAVDEYLWSCLWDVRFPDENNKIFIQGVWDDDLHSSYASVIGGTGRFHTAKGTAKFNPTNNSVPENWTFSIDMLFGCLQNNESNFYNLTISQSNVNVETFPASTPYKRRGSVDGSGVVSLWEGSGLNFTFNLWNDTTIDWTYPVDDDQLTLTLKGKCILENDLLTSLCTWIFAFNDQDTLSLSGRIIGTEATNITVAGGSGAFRGARGPAVYDPEYGWDLSFTISSEIPVPVAAAPRMFVVAALFYLCVAWLLF